MTKSPENCIESGPTVSEARGLLYLTFVMVLIASGYGGYLVFNELKHSQEAVFKQRAESIIYSLAQLGEYHITTFDWPLLEQLVRRTKSDPVVSSVQIEDFLSEQTFGEMNNEPQENLKHYTKEIHQDGRHIGRVSVMIDETPLKQTLAWLRSFLWFAVAAIVLVITGLTYMLIQAKNYTNAIKREVDERRKAEDSLKKLSMAVEQSPVSVVITDKSAAIEYVNPKFLEVTGYSAEEVIGRDPSILNSGLTPKETYRKLWDKLTAGEEWRGRVSQSE